MPDFIPDDISREDVYGVGRDIVGLAARSDRLAEMAARQIWKKALDRYSPRQAQAVILNGESIVATFNAPRVYEVAAPVRGDLLDWIHAEDDGPGVWIRKDRPDLWATIKMTPGGRDWLTREIEDFESVLTRGELASDRPPVSEDSLNAGADDEE